ncbi:UDP-N-acetylmuramyl peptide synthase [Oceanobacillus sp. E9]|uniref:UDP-N-acetylmuramoyl-L-alanyl-D-glutamate--2, 6-diaminopimelate ligase n=1 Tax=Oceanobacillus TaxID=182709 RepID=UPI00084E5A56|nr:MULTISPECIES: UDP-N-acetylmuramoyl-L-alanyl-D-glutamate--2,6-diaminopimelate ligase [Oceanobacillus]OEH55570.1 UDP-N-acetylmuramyl peptide synthase [Oceanobacillus sp. E9]
MNTYDLISALKIKQQIGQLPNVISSISHNSRQVTDNSLFICISGFTVDGHKFVTEAIENGATCIVAEREIDIDTNKAALIIVPDTNKAIATLAATFYNHPSHALTLYGVTGTNGKTTVTTIIKHLLTQNGLSAALIGTNGFQINEDIYSSSNNTTSDILTNQHLLSESKNQGVTHVAMEVSSHGLEQGRLWGIDFSVATFTNLSHEHLDYHGSMEEYAATKVQLFSSLSIQPNKQKFAILNRDDSWYDFFQKRTPVQIVSYGIHEEADFRATGIKYHKDGTTFELLTPEGNYRVQTKLMGEFNVYNILAAIATVYTKESIPLKKLVKSIEFTPSPPGRMEKLENDGGRHIYIDYAHTPDALTKAINSLLPFKQNKLIVVVGTGGDRDKSIRPLLAIAASVADYVILTINDPRHEDPNKILQDLEKGMLHHQYACIADRKLAIREAINRSSPDDIILIAGKGKEPYQIIKNKKVAHNDATIALECSKELFPNI